MKRRLSKLLLYSLIGFLGFLMVTLASGVVYLRNNPVDLSPVLGFLNKQLAEQNLKVQLQVGGATVDMRSSLKDVVIAVRDVTVATSAQPDQPFVRLASGQLRLSWQRLVMAQIRPKEVLFQGLKATLQRRQDGQLEIFSQMTEPPSAASSPHLIWRDLLFPHNHQKAPPRLVITDSQVQLIDRQLGQQRQLRIHRLQADPTPTRVEDLLKAELIDDHTATPVTANLFCDKGAPVECRAELLLQQADWLSVRANWPESAAPKARQWVFDNIKSGEIHGALFQLPLQLTANNQWSIGQWLLNFQAKNLTMSYFRQLPHLQISSAAITIDGESLSAEVEAGKAGELILAGGEVKIAEFSAPITQLSVKTTLTGDWLQTLGYLNHEPIGLEGRVKQVNFKEFTAQSQADVTLSLPLTADVELEDVQLKVTGQLDQLTTGRPVFQQTLNNSHGKVDFQLRQGLVALAIELDATGSELGWDDLPWRKPVGEGCRLVLSFTEGRDALILKTIGNPQYQSEIEIKWEPGLEVTIALVKWQDNKNIKAKVVEQTKGYKISVSGDTLIYHLPLVGGPSSTAPEDELSQPPALNLELRKIGAIQTAEDRRLEQVEGTLNLRGSEPLQGKLTAKIPESIAGGAYCQMDLEPETTEDYRTAFMSCDSAGAAMAFAKLPLGVEEGRLQLEAQFLPGDTLGGSNCCQQFSPTRIATHG